MATSPPPRTKETHATCINGSSSTNAWYNATHMILYALSLDDRLTKSRGSCIRKFTWICNVMHCIPLETTPPVNKLSRKPREHNNPIFQVLIRFGFAYDLDLGWRGNCLTAYHMLVRTDNAIVFPRVT